MHPIKNFLYDGKPDIKTIDKNIVITHLQFPNKNIITSKDAFNAYKEFFDV